MIIDYNEIRENIMNKRIFLISGASGHLGYNLISLLLEKGEEVVALYLPNENIYPHNTKYDGQLTAVRGDITNKEDIDKMFSFAKQKDIIFVHCAGLISIKGSVSSKVYQVNVVGTQNVTDICIEHQVHKLLYVSSVHAIKPLKNEVMHESHVFDPTDVKGEYAKTKSLATKYVYENCLKNEIDFVIVHPSGLIGPNDHLGKGHINNVIRDYIQGSLTSIVKGGYDMTDVRDVADGIYQACVRPTLHHFYILSNRYITIKELIDIASNIISRKTIKRVLPISFVYVIAPLAELYAKIRHEPPMFTAYSMSALNEKTRFSHDLATEDLDYHPRYISESIKDTIDFLVSIGTKIKKK